MSNTVGMNDTTSDTITDVRVYNSLYKRCTSCKRVKLLSAFRRRTVRQMYTRINKMCLMCNLRGSIYMRRQSERDTEYTNLVSKRSYYNCTYGHVFGECDDYDASRQEYKAAKLFRDLNRLLFNC